LYDIEHGTKTTLDYVDECRASIEAARSTPNLTNEDKRNLIMDAIYRANEAGQYIENDDFMKEVLYGYRSDEKNISSTNRGIRFIDKESQDRLDAERLNGSNMSQVWQQDSDNIQHRRKVRR
jgi:hypothetical protein